MENGPKILEFNSSARKKTLPEKEAPASEDGELIEVYFEKEKLVRNLKKELEALKKEKENALAKIILGEDAPRQKASVRRDFIYKLDDFKYRVEETIDSLSVLAFTLKDKGLSVERDKNLLEKLSEIEKGIKDIREEIWAASKS
jgi:hypothetical protein